MKNISILLFITFLFIGCNPINNSNNNESHTNLKKNQLVGTVILKSRKISRQSEKRINEYFIRVDGKDYFVKFSEGYIQKDKLANFLNKEIIFKGDLKNGEIEPPAPSSITNPNTPKARQGYYVALYKIIN